MVSDLDDNGLVELGELFLVEKDEERHQQKQMVLEELVLMVGSSEQQQVAKVLAIGYSYRTACG